MKYGQLKKQLKLGDYISFKRGCLYFSKHTYKFWLKGTRAKKKPHKKYTCVIEGEYDSFICEVEEYALHNNKDIIEYLKNSKRDKGKLVKVGKQ